MTKLRFIGLDVDAERIAVAVAEPGGEVRSLGTIPNRLESIRKTIGKLGPVKDLRACHEARPTGYVPYWQLTQLGVDCQVVAPTVVPVKAGDRVKEIAWKAQHRLHKRYVKLTSTGKNKNQTGTAAGRELRGFLWDIAVRTEGQYQQQRAA